MAETQPNGHSEVPQEAGGLPQLNVIADGSYTNQLFWLLLTFVALYIIVSRLVLPRLTSVIETRDEQIRADLDKAERDRKDSEASAATVDAILGDARAKAQTIVADAKVSVQSEMTDAIAKLDKEIDARVGKAEAEVFAARDAALSEIQTVATEVAQDIVTRLTGVEADAAAVSAAVETSLTQTKGGI